MRLPSGGLPSPLRRVPPCDLRHEPLPRHRPRRGPGRRDAACGLPAAAAGRRARARGHRHRLRRHRLALPRVAGVPVGRARARPWLSYLATSAGETGRRWRAVRGCAAASCSARCCSPARWPTGATRLARARRPGCCARRSAGVAVGGAVERARAPPRRRRRRRCSPPTRTARAACSRPSRSSSRRSSLRGARRLRRAARRQRRGARARSTPACGSCADRCATPEEARPRGHRLAQAGRCSTARSRRAARPALAALRRARHLRPRLRVDVPVGDAGGRGGDRHRAAGRTSTTSPR